MKILYIFPHPDDESFGPAAAIHSQIQKGHQVSLLTLTKGGATRQRHKLGLSIEEMGEIRYQEMLKVRKTLGLENMTVLDFPDNALKELDPREIEKAIKDHMEKLRPDIVVTYPIHGISGFHDHIVAHFVVRRVYIELKENGADYLKRLAFMTVPDNGESVWQKNGFPRLKHSDSELIDCIIPLDSKDLEALTNSLLCYETYKDTIEESGVLEKIGDKLYFEIWDENFDPPLEDLTSAIKH